LITDELRSYGAAGKSVMRSVEHVTARYANNRAEVSHQPSRQRERQTRGFKSAAQAQRFVSVLSAQSPPCTETQRNQGFEQGDV